eukprot:GILK01002015.1.p1 GENE.GILK01002015.1~~GILK01002015.1.p1  ORF type:complete len:192 (-),score=33.22 GILK01002015.1:148-684(-)
MEDRRAKLAALAAKRRQEMSMEKYGDREPPAHKTAKSSTPSSSKPSGSSAVSRDSQKAAVVSKPKSVAPGRGDPIPKKASAVASSKPKSTKRASDDEDEKRPSKKAKVVETKSKKQQKPTKKKGSDSDSDESLSDASESDLDIDTSLIINEPRRGRAGRPTSFKGMLPSDDEDDDDDE